MVEIAALLSVERLARIGSAISSHVDRLTSRLSSAPGRQGTRRLRGGQAPHGVAGRQVLVQVVGGRRPSPAPRRSISSCRATRPATDVVVDAWLVRELVFRQPLERRDRRRGARSGVKLAGTAYRRDDFTPEAFFDYWQQRARADLGEGARARRLRRLAGPRAARRRALSGRPPRAVVAG